MATIVPPARPANVPSALIAPSVPGGTGRRRHLLGTVAEKRGWLDNDLLNAVNTAIGAALVVMMARMAA